MSIAEKTIRLKLAALNIAPIKRLENPAMRRGWHRYPDWAKMRLLADAFHLVAEGFKNCAPSKASRK